MILEMLYNFRDIVIGPHLDERRNMPRARCNLALSCQTPDGAMVCSLRDLSSKGARLVTDQKCRKGLAVILVPPRGMGDQSKGMKGKVAWCRPTRGRHLIGIVFTSPPSGWVSTVLRELGLSTTPPTQQRKFVRVPGDMRVELSAQGFAKTTQMRDLSVGGALLLSQDKLGREHPVRLTLPGQADVPELQLAGLVKACRKRSDSDNFELSVEFNEPTPKQRKLLVKHLSYLMRRSLAH